MKKLLCILLVALGTTNHAFSQNQQVSYREAEEVATNWIQIHCPEYLSKKNIVHLQNREGHTLLYEIRFDSINILLSGSKACLPVLGYYKGNSSIINNLDNLPCNLKNFISSYIEEIENCFLNDTIRLYHNNDWNSLLVETLSIGRSSVMVEPLITTKWGQNWSNTGNDFYAYNYEIPPDNGGNCLHCLVGCGAVALAQVMNYWQCPVLLDAPQQFDWCNMTDSLNRWTDSDYEKHRDAIAYLMYHCAEEIHSVYGCNSTTSYLADIRTALINRYGYSNSATIVTRRSQMDNWPVLIMSKLDKKQPILYFGTGPSGGHFFICDGYQDDRMFHLNWGWNGQFDGFFSLDNLTPNGYIFNNNQAAIFDILPRIGSSICNVNLYLDVFYHDNPSLLNDYHPDDITPQTMTTLTSASATSDAAWRTIFAGDIAVYQAHKEVVLQDGFEAKYGCEFEARIDPCVKCDGNQRGFSLNNSMAIDNYDSISIRFEKTNGDMRKITEIIATDLFPNPTDGPLTMATNGMTESVLIYDIAGHLVGGWNLRTLLDDYITLDVSGLHSGTYLLTVTTPSGSRTARFIRK